MYIRGGKFFYYMLYGLKRGVAVGTIRWVVNMGEGVMVFRRYPRLEVGYGSFDMGGYLVGACLEMGDSVESRESEADEILNDSWVVNLRRQEREGYMTEFLEGIKEEVRKLWEEHGVDVAEELSALKKVYEDTLEKTKANEAMHLDDLERRMRSYLKIRDERQAIKVKLMNLENKMKKHDEDDEEGE